MKSADSRCREVQARVTELERELARYQEREETITEALLVASRVRTEASARATSSRPSTSARLKPMTA